MLVSIYDDCNCIEIPFSETDFVGKNQTNNLVYYTEIYNSCGELVLTTNENSLIVTKGLDTSHCYSLNAIFKALVSYESYCNDGCNTEFKVKSFYAFVETGCIAESSEYDVIEHDNIFVDAIAPNGKSIEDIYKTSLIPNCHCHCPSYFEKLDILENDGLYGIQINGQTIIDEFNNREVPKFTKIGETIYYEVLNGCETITIYELYKEPRPDQPVTEPIIIDGTKYYYYFIEEFELCETQNCNCPDYLIFRNLYGKYESVSISNVEVSAEGRNAEYLSGCPDGVVNCGDVRNKYTFDIMTGCDVDRAKLNYHIFNSFDTIMYYNGNYINGVITETSLKLRGKGKFTIETGKSIY